MNPIRLGLFAASPVYYQAPLYRRIADDPRIEFTAIFASDQGASRPFDNGYSTPVEWGVDPLGGYEATFLRKAATNPPGGSVLTLRDWDVAPRIWRGRYDALWLHGYHTATHVVAAMAQKARKRAVLYREDQNLLTPRARWKAAVKQVGLRPLFHGSYGLFVGSENRRWFERWGMPADRLFHVPYAVDNEGLRDAATALGARRPDLARELGLPAGQPVVVTVGRLIEKKQPLRVLEAFAEVRREAPCTLLVVGTGPLEDDMRALVERRAIPDVVFAGFLDQSAIARAYAAADVFTLFSAYDETWGLVVNEAMNFGLPLVLSDRVGSASDLVVEEENGFVVSHRDVEAYAVALRRLIVSAELRARMGAASRAIVSAYTYDRAVAGLLDAVAAAVGPSRWAAASEAAPSAAGVSS